MSVLALPARARRRAVLDPRLVIGLVLVLGSIAGVVGLVRAAGSTIAVYAAAHPLLPGDRIDAGDLVVRNVELDGADRRYLLVGALPKGGANVLATVRTGELVPVGALGSASSADATSIVLQLGGPVGASVVAGTRVEVWSSPPSTTASAASSEAPTTPTVLAESATVVSVSADSSLVAHSSSTTVELIVPRDRVAALLAARSAGDSISVLPVGVPLGSSR